MLPWESTWLGGGGDGGGGVVGVRVGGVSFGVLMLVLIMGYWC